MREIHDFSCAFFMYGNGAGKILLAHAVLGILPPKAQMGGTIDGEVLSEARKRDSGDVRCHYA